MEAAMHEHGLMKKLLAQAEAEAAKRGGALRTVKVRLGAMASSDPDHFRGDFEHVCEETGREGLGLEIEVDAARPSGVELIGVELAGSDAG